MCTSVQLSTITFTITDNIVKLWTQNKHIDWKSNHLVLTTISKCLFLFLDYRTGISYTISRDNSLLSMCAIFFILEENTKVLLCIFPQLKNWLNLIFFDGFNTKFQLSATHDHWINNCTSRQKDIQASLFIF